jgi:serine O-acetyltransferase
MSKNETFQQLLPELVSQIVEDIRRTPHTQHIERFSLPNRAEVVRILVDLQSLLFPGYFRQQLHLANLEFFVGDLIDSLYFRMQREVAGALCHENCKACVVKSEPELEDHATAIVTEFFKRVPRIRQMLEKDLQAAYDGDPAAKSFVEIVLTYPGFEAITTHRIAHELLVMGVPLVPRMMNEHIHHRTGIDIHPGARIGESFFIDHGTGVVIGETSLIGNSVKVYQGVTLGALSFPKDERGQIIRGRKRHPTIEDNVTIYANATILGGDTVIGYGCVIGGNVWLTESVPPYTKVYIENPNLRYVTKEAPVGQTS